MKRILFTVFKPTYKPLSVSRAEAQAVIISLARTLLCASCSLPDAGRVAPLHLLDLAPGGSLPSRDHR